MIRRLGEAQDAPGVVDLIHEVFPAGTTTVASWLQQQAAIPPRARHASWVAIVDGALAGRAEATLKWWSASGAAFASVNVSETYRGRGIGGSLWERVENHLEQLGPSRVTTMFVENPAGVAFARARGFAEERAEELSCVDPTTVAPAPADDACRVVPLRDVAPDEVYEVDLATTPDVPATDMVDAMPYDEWLETIWRRPTITLDGSFGAIVDERLVAFTLLAANIERGRAFTEYTATLAEYRNRGIADRLKRASLSWAAAEGIRAAWTTNDETNAAMLAVNRRLGYTGSLRRVEYLRER
jgi:GNAT superfamily N-acetyltransferase